MQDILIALGIAAAVAFLLMMLFQSATKAAKGNAPVAPQSTTASHIHKPVAAAAAAAPAAAAATHERASSAPTAASPNAAAKGKKETKAEAKRRRQEEAEEDALIEEELRRTANGIRKDRNEVINLEAQHKKREAKEQRTVKKAEGAHFSERQAAEERASGFHVINDSDRKQQERSKQHQHADKSGKSQSPDGSKNKRGSPKSGSPKSREEMLDAALRSVLNKRGGKGGRGRGGGGRFDDDGAGFQRNNNNNEGGDSGHVEIKGNVTNKSWQAAPHKN